MAGCNTETDLPEIDESPRITGSRDREVDSDASVNREEDCQSGREDSKKSVQAAATSTRGVLPRKPRVPFVLGPEVLLRPSDLHKDGHGTVDKLKSHSDGIVEYVPENETEWSPDN